MSNTVSPEKAALKHAFDAGAAMVVDAMNQVHPIDFEEYYNNLQDTRVGVMLNPKGYVFITTSGFDKVSQDIKKLYEDAEFKMMYGFDEDE